MSHHTYTTEAFVLGAIDVGEGSRSLILYTKELGLLYGLARSVREVRSKLRYALQPFSLAEVSLVRGRDVWRVTGARPLISYYALLQRAPARQQTFLRIVALMRRLIRGEVPGEDLFTMLSQAFAFLAQEDLSGEELSLFECVVVLRLLSLLGYAAETAATEEPSDRPITRELLVELRAARKKFVQAINRSLAATQL